MKKVQHRKSATQKKWNMKKVQHKVNLKSERNSEK